MKDPPLTIKSSKIIQPVCNVPTFSASSDNSLLLVIRSFDQKRETRNETKSYDSIHGFCELSAEHIPVACIFESLASRISRCNIKFNFLQSMWTNDVKLSSSEVPVLKQASKILSEETSLSVSSLANV